MTKITALLYVLMFGCFLIVGGAITWGNASMVEFQMFILPPHVIRLGYLVIVTFVCGMFFCLLMVGGYWWVARSRISLLNRELRIAQQELNQLRMQEIRPPST